MENYLITAQVRELIMQVLGQTPAGNGVARLLVHLEELKPHVLESTHKSEAD